MFNSVLFGGLLIVSFKDCPIELSSETMRQDVDIREI